MFETDVRDGRALVKNGVVAWLLAHEIVYFHTQTDITRLRSSSRLYHAKVEL